VFFQVPDAPKPVFGEPQTSVGELVRLPQIPIWLGRVFQLSEGGRSKANMS